MFENFVRFNHRKRMRQFSRNGFQAIDVMIEDDCQHRSAVAHLIEQFGVPVVGIDGNDARSHRIQRQQVNEIVRPVLEKKSDPMAGPIA